MNNELKFLSHNETKEMLEKYSITIPKLKVTKNEEDSVNAAKEIGYPVVMKIISEDIVHKTEAGGVIMSLSNEEEVRIAFVNMMKGIKNYNPNARIEGVCIEKMINEGVEVIVGIKQDNTFGATIIFGLGGIFVELLNDVSTRVLPIKEVDIRDMINEVKGSRILEGFRSRNKSDIKELINIIKKVSEIALNEQKIIEMDLNPIIVHEEGKGATIVDARMLGKE